MKTTIYKSLLLTVGCLIWGAQKVEAQNFIGNFSASEQEIQKHRQEIKRFTDIAAKCMEDEYAHHVSFYRTHGISPYYGSNTDFKRANLEGRRAILRGLERSMRRPEGSLTRFAETMKQTSCVGYAIDCYGKAFNQTGQSAVWNRLRSFTAANATDGSALMDGLRKIGWTVYYWNPDPSRNAAWDADEQRRDPTNESRIWGWHEYRLTILRRTGKYYKNVVNDQTTLVGFGNRTPELLRRAPLFWGIAHSGFHVFPGMRGEVIESHSTRRLNDPNTMERGVFNPLAGQAPFGKYYSGLVALPPEASRGGFGGFLRRR